MTERAQEVKHGPLWKQEHLSPLPIPTGQPASDLMNNIWRKNDVYLDIGSFAMGWGVDDASRAHCFNFGHCLVGRCIWRYLA